jgi:hypothetical protein
MCSVLSLIHLSGPEHRQFRRAFLRGSYTRVAIRNFPGERDYFFLLVDTRLIAPVIDFVPAQGHEQRNRNRGSDTP